MKKKYKSLRKFILAQVQKGRNSFCFQEAYDYHGGTKASVQQSLYRLLKGKMLFSPKQDFFVIVPPENRERGSVSSLEFIDAYMEELESPYYVGLLSAAFLWGASHQQPQRLQVLSQKQVAPIHKGEAHVQFYTSPPTDPRFLVNHKTSYGYVRVSSPALTVMDLFRFPHACGYLNTMATVISDLAEQVNGRDLKQVIDQQAKVPHVQRLGYISSLLGLEKIEKVCESFLSKKGRLTVALLNPHLKGQSGDLNQKWAIRINDTIETDI